ncbi:hypothetical protein ACFXKC_40750 [Streptomyces sp. NPDC059340]|uniref:hypothetical protein n=1 Tax=Streptomyces sp. NPDC059340 TaxID=3346806 RepID=UPI0036AFC919
MTDTDRIVVWLREAMDAAERRADRWHDVECDVHTTSLTDAAVLQSATLCDCGGPKAVLRRIAADRKTLALHTTPHTVVESAVEPVGELFCGECGGPCTHKGEAECVICGQTPCDTVRNLAEGYGWTEETT